MRNYLILIHLIVLSIACSAAYGDPSTQLRLQATAVVEDSKWANAPNSPIWLDVKIVNTSNITFAGTSYCGDGRGIVGETHRPSKTDIARCLTSCDGYDSFCDLISLKPGESYINRVLLNNLVHPLRPGLMSIWILVPLSPNSGPSICLTPEVTLRLGPVLSDQKVQGVYNAVLSSLSHGHAEDRVDALKEAAALPYDYALRALTAAVVNDGLGMEVLPFINKLPHNQKGKELIQEMANSKSTIEAEAARQYLSNY